MLLTFFSAHVHKLRSKKSYTDVNNKAKRNAIRGTHTKFLESEAFSHRR